MLEFNPGQKRFATFNNPREMFEERERKSRAEAEYFLLIYNQEKISLQRQRALDLVENAKASRICSFATEYSTMGTK